MFVRERTGFGFAGQYISPCGQHYLDLLRPIRTAEDFEAVAWLRQRTWPPVE